MTTNSSLVAATAAVTGATHANVEAIIRSVSRDEEARLFLQAAFDGLWDKCCGRYAGLKKLQRDRARKRLACCLALISTGMFAETHKEARAIADRLRETVCETDFLISCSRTLDFSKLK